MVKREKITMLALLVALLIVCGINTASGKVIYVDDDANGLNSGTSWQNAFNDFQNALFSAQEGDEIRVAQGIYIPYQGPTQNPDGSIVNARPATFRLINNVTILGGFAGVIETSPDERDIVKYQTILSGDFACWNNSLSMSSRK